MIRGPLADPNFRPQFSGHETFPLRHLWLKKAYDQVLAASNDAKRKAVFTSPDAIVTFGVGKNMVSSIRHWALTCGVISETQEAFVTTPLGDLLFSDNSGVDPFLESPATLWLLHWAIAATPHRSTTWFFAFNHFAEPIFDQESLGAALREYRDIQNAGSGSTTKIRASDTTVKRDVECFFRTYTPARSGRSVDDIFEPALVPLSLIRTTANASYHFNKGPQPSLPDSIVAYATVEFWLRYAPEQRTLSVEALTFEPGSPGKVFKLGQEDLVERLTRIEESSQGTLIWTDSAGVRNVTRRYADLNPLALLAHAYRAR